LGNRVPETHTTHKRPGVNNLVFFLSKATCSRNVPILDLISPIYSSNGIISTLQSKMIGSTKMMLSNTEIQSRLERILPTVQKPGRYTGGELNQVIKKWDEIKTKIALVFPDIYDLGMSNLGLAILYDLINQRPDTLAERTFAPWTDMETAMRENGIPLFSLETKHSLADFDIIGFSLPYETLYTSTLNLLDLGGIPIFTKDRGPEHPLILSTPNRCMHSSMYL